MKKLLPVFCTLVLALATARADLTITEELQSEGGPTGSPKTLTMTKKIKGSMARVDMSPQVATIINTKTGDVITLMSSQKVAMSLPGAMVKALTAKMASSMPNTSATPPPAPKPTGRKETINGYETEEYTTDLGNAKVSFWLAPNFPDKALVSEEYSKLSDQMGSQFPQFAAYKAMSNGIQAIGYPIRTVVESPTAGKTTITLAGVSKDPIPDSDFKIPAGYRSMNMPAIPQLQK